MRYLDPSGTKLRALRSHAFTIATGASNELDGLAPLFAAEGVPALRSLEIVVGPPAPLCRALVRSPLASQLESLVIRHRLDLDPAIRAALVERAPFVQLVRS